MPKFLDTPVWYDATGAEVVGMGYSSSASRTAIGIPYHGPNSYEGMSLISGTAGQVLQMVTSGPYTIPKFADLPHLYLHIVHLSGRISSNVGGDASVNLTFMTISNSASELAYNSGRWYAENWGVNSNNLCPWVTGTIGQNTDIAGWYGTARPEFAFKVNGVGNIYSWNSQTTSITHDETVVTLI